MTVAAAAVQVGIAVLVCGYAVLRTRREPRRISNAYWLFAALVLAGNVPGVLTLDGDNPVLGLLAVAVVLSPLIALVLGGFLVANGVVMLRRERASLANSLSLLAGVGVLVLLAGAVPVLAAGPMWLRAAWLCCGLAACYLAVQFSAFLAYGWVYRMIAARRPAGWVVVLGAGLVRNQVSPLLASRITVGLRELARRGARLLVLSGGRGSDESVAEGEAMAHWALRHGADPRTVRAETRSRTTRENLTFSRDLVGPGPGLVVTSNYHVLRAAVLARSVGVDAQVVGAPTAGYYWPSAILREFVALLRERVRLHATLLGLAAVPVPVLLLVVA